MSEQRTRDIEKNHVNKDRALAYCRKNDIKALIAVIEAPSVATETKVNAQEILSRYVKKIYSR